MKYIALTLGPITRTIEMAENTRSLWAASYLFSYLGKKIIEPFMDRSFLLPYICKEMFEKNFKGAGVFPDRYIFKAEEGDFDKLSEHVKDVLNKLAGTIGEKINCDEKEIEEYLKKYFKVYFFEKEFDTNNEKEIKKSCEKSLALLEQQDSIVPMVNDNRQFLNKLFDRVPGSFLAKDAGLGEGFKTIVNISSGEDIETPKHPYQRYIAVVKADGDSMGDAFKATSDANKLSEALFEFNKKAVDIIRDNYKGLPVFIGGDDLLFFAPIYSKNGSVFSLLQSLDTEFHNIISEKADLKERDKHPTMSFGVSISYYKYPMFEALELADKLLAKAKAARGDKPLKNNIVFSVQRHSGQTRAALLHKGNVDTLEKYNKFVNDYMKNIAETNDSKSEKEKLLTSAMHSLREKEFLLSVAIKQSNTLENYFKNNFNEVVHDKYSNFFTDLRELLWTAYNDFAKEGILDNLSGSLPESMKVKKAHMEDLIPTPEKAAIETAYNALQFVHLVNKRNDEDESI